LYSSSFVITSVAEFIERLVRMRKVTDNFSSKTLIGLLLPRITLGVTGKTLNWDHVFLTGFW